MYNTVAESDGQLVVYHGTGAEFSSFNLSAEGYFGRGGIYFTDSKQAATKFANQCISGGRVVQATISMANPYRVDFEDQTDDVKIEELKDRGFDGIIMETETIEGSPDTMYVVFRAEQVTFLESLPPEPAGSAGD